MKDVKDFITLVIHTPEHAQNLKNILEYHNIEVRIENFVSFKSSLVVAQRVKIRASALPLALKIIESGENYASSLVEMKMAGMSGNLLIPVDFSPSSLCSIEIGFKLAVRMGVHPIVLHSFVAPMFSISGGSLEYGNQINEIQNAQEVKNIKDQSSKNLAKLKKDINILQKSGKLPDIKFSTILTEGIPEEAIIEYCKDNSPVLVVMSTRGKIKKDEELIGSVTAEVLDSCRVPIFTVPDNYQDIQIEDMKNLLYFCNLDQHDIITLDTLMRIFDFPECNITLVAENPKRQDEVKNKLSQLTSFFSSNYPVSKFDFILPSVKNYREDIDKIINSKHIDLLVLPNKKTNVFTRLFHPTQAHKYLFERDMPMLAIPV